jgi:hypothetical protein
MRTYEFRCSGCRKLVTEAVPGYEGRPELCRACRTRRSVLWAKSPAGHQAKPAKPRKAAKAPPRLQPTCPRCGGRGKVIEELCRACDGTGVQWI